MKLIILAALISPFLIGCYYGQRSATIQSSDKCYLQFGGNTDGVKIVIDKDASFTLTADDDAEQSKSAKLYLLQPGKHRVQAYKNEQVILDRLIYIGNNETKELSLP